MAALGARASVRDPLSGADAVMAQVSIRRIRSTLLAGAEGLAALILSGQERVLFARAVTVKRKAEFLAGRLAAKCVCLTLRAESAGASAFDTIDVRRETSGAPVCVWPDGTTQRVSIAHAGDFAMALATTDDAECGLDVHPVSRNLELGPDALFHSLERLQIREQADARLCWTVREAWGKLTTRGVAADLDALATVRAAEARWLALSRPIASAALVGAGENSAMAISVAIRRDGRHGRQRWLA